MSGYTVQNLPRGWRKAPLGTLVTILRGVSYKKQDATTEPAVGNIPILRATNIGDRLSLSGLVYVPKDCVSQDQMLNIGDIVIAASSGSQQVVGKAAVLTEPWVGSFGAFCYALRPCAKETAGYLAFFLQTATYRNHVASLCAGVNINNLRRKDIESVLLPVAPLNEQRRIVAKVEELFSELDKGIESLKTARRQLEVYLQSVLRHAFEGKLTAQWRKENKDKLETPEQLLTRIRKERMAHHERQLQEWKPNANGGERTIRRSLASSRTSLKDVSRLSSQETEDLPFLPSGWSYVRLGLLIDEPKYGTSKKCDYNFEGTGVLRIPNVVRGVIDDADLKGACFEEHEKLAYSLRSGDILMIRSNGSISIVGKCALVSSAEQRYLYAGYLIRIRSNPTVVLPDYLAALMSSHLVRVQIEGCARSTSGVNNINSGEIQSLIVPLCGVQEQQEVVARLSAVISRMDATATEIDEQLRTTNTLRQTILKKAFAGHLVAQDPSDEPASVLLEKIRTERAKAGMNGPTARKNRKAKTAA